MPVGNADPSGAAPAGVINVPGRQPGPHCSVATIAPIPANMRPASGKLSLTRGQSSHRRTYPSTWFECVVTWCREHDPLGISWMSSNAMRTHLESSVVGS